MCGIVGGTDPSWRYEAAVESLHHRGPDSSAVRRFDNACLGFARLSIVDPIARADQPMTASNGTLTIVFNGEIYGFRELKATLEARGHIFRTESDTEVLLNAFLEWGERFVEHVDGMFAVAFFEKAERKIRLFRDRMGIKPLYFFYDGKNFAFASELKALVALLPSTSLTLNPTAFYDFLTYRYVPTPRTMYREVSKLPPGHQITFDLSSSRIVSQGPYWKLEVDPRPPPLSVGKASVELLSLLTESVRDQLIADVPVGFFLSGGLDSSAIVATAAGLRENLETFSIGFDVREHSELEFAALVAERFSTKHHVRELSSEQTESLFSSLASWYDEPFADTSAFPTYLVSQFAREHVSVVLTGDGGDEVFGGYRWYRFFERLSKFQLLEVPAIADLWNHAQRRLPRARRLTRVLGAVAAITSSPLAAYTRLLGGLVKEQKRDYAALFGIPGDYDDYWYFRQHWVEELPLLTRLQYLDVKTYLHDDILTKVDRVSMAASLEARVPFLSKKVVEYVFNVPENVRFCGGDLKGLLRSAMANKLPAAILRRAKKGFSIPPSHLGQRRDQEIVLERLFPEALTRWAA